MRSATRRRHRELLGDLETSSVDKVELHGFGEASERAYGTAVYICAEVKDGNRISNFVMASQG